MNEAAIYRGIIAMATVWIPPLMRDITQGKREIKIEANSVRQLIERLNKKYPGIKDRLIEENRLRANIALVVDGYTSHEGLRQKIGAESEVHFVPAISGG